jgi:CDGSH-type Zn-finger protein
MQYTAKRDQTVWFCGCKKAGTAPLCDGTHSDL